MLLRLKPEIYMRLAGEFYMSQWKEVCGVLLSAGATITDVVPLKNVSDFPAMEFAFDPDEQVTVWEYADTQNKKIAAIYHSHVSKEAYPSLIDIKYAAYPYMYYIIINRTSMRAFRIVGGIVSEEPIELSS